MPTPTDPFSFSPPDSPTTAMDNIRAGPDPAEESPRRSVRPENVNKGWNYKRFDVPAAEFVSEVCVTRSGHNVKDIKVLHGERVNA